MSDRLGDTPSTEVYSAHVALSRYIVYSTLHNVQCTYLVCNIFFSTEPSWQPLGVAVASELHCTAVCVQVWDLGFMENSVVCVAQGYCSQWWRDHPSGVGRWAVGSHVTTNTATVLNWHRHIFSGIFIVELYIFMDIVLKVCYLCRKTV